jgi:zinc transport system substrate-binding protein
MRCAKRCIIIFISLVWISSFSLLSCTQGLQESQRVNNTDSIAASETSEKAAEEIEVEENIPMEIAVTIPPLAEFVEAITGNRANVTVMVPPGASPHTYEPRQSQLVSLSNAIVYVKVGTPVEFEISWLPKIKEMNERMLIVDCSESIMLIDGGNGHEHEDDHPHEEDGGDTHSHEGLHDPHIWLSLKNASVMVKNIYEKLVEIDPINKDYYRENMEVYLKDIEDLDKEIETMFTGIENKKFMVYHDSWAYFAKDYGLTQIPIEKDGKEPTPKGLKELIDQAKREEIKVIFASPEFNISSAEVIAEEIGAAVVLISPLAGDYLDNMRNISKEISKNFRP